MKLSRVLVSLQVLFGAEAVAALRPEDVAVESTARGEVDGDTTAIVQIAGVPALLTHRTADDLRLSVEARSMGLFRGANMGLFVVFVLLCAYFGFRVVWKLFGERRQFQTALRRERSSELHSERPACSTERCDCRARRLSILPPVRLKHALTQLHVLVRQ